MALVIKTKYLSPTDTRGDRIKCWTDTYNRGSMSATIGWDYSLDTVENHFKAVKAFCEKYNLDWLKDGNMETDKKLSHMVYGSDNKGYYFCFPYSKIRINY
tara:strand:+ start:92 stop:394 length:303 start_codon:yes stop_codon:yes gene_type:complete